METLLIKDLPTQDRPRERLAELGPAALRAAELIAILLRTGTKGVSAIQVAEDLLRRFSSLSELSTASWESISQVHGIGRDKALALQAAFNLAGRIAGERRIESPLLDTPEKVAELLRYENLGHRVEVFQVVLLNTRRRLIRVEQISQGTLDTLLVHPREVFRSAILSNAAALVVVHNHPSGDPTPSDADIRVTRDLIRAGQLLKIDLLDHVILGQRMDHRSKDYCSLRELGYWAGT
jgi:DNA repair protein RadC